MVFNFCYGIGKVLLERQYRGYPDDQSNDRQEGTDRKKNVPVIDPANPGHAKPESKEVTNSNENQQIPDTFLISRLNDLLFSLKSLPDTHENFKESI